MEFRLQKKTYIMLFLMVLTLVIASCTTEQQAQNNENPEDTVQEETVTAEEVTQEETGSGNLVTFVVTGENFFFEMNGDRNPDLRVKEGDTVRIEFTSTDGFHDWVVDEFDAATERVSTGGTSTVEFVADKTGTFPMICQVFCGSGHGGMKGKLIVEE